MGRPRKSEPRDRQLNLSLTENELKSLEQRAQAVGMRPVHFGRALLLDAKKSPTVGRQQDGNLLRLVHAQLIRLGNNLNQMLRHIHSTGEAPPPDLVPLLRDIRQIIARAAK